MRKKGILGLPRNVILLGWTSFFTDAGSEMILPVLPLFLRGALGAPMVAIGLIEGVAEATANFLRLGSGVFADRIGKSKPLVFAGYAISAVVKPLLALVPTWHFVLGVRFMDRVGKGIRSAPRDSLVASSAPKSIMGKAYGFHRAMDTAGAIIGSGVAMVALLWVNDVKSPWIRWLFAASAVPCLLALIFVALVKENRTSPDPGTGEKPPISNPFALPAQVWILLAGIALWELGNISYAFILLRLTDLSVPVRVVPMIYFAFNIAYTLVAMPIGMAADRIGVRASLMLAPLLGAAAFITMGIPGHWAVVTAGMFLFALHSAAVNTVPRFAIGRLAPASTRGTSFGMVGICAFLGNTLAGFLWQKLGSGMAMQAAGCLSLLSLLPFLFLRAKTPAN